jgi:predicted 3-demethylubiquinone-9 3-methyltransferase (glyoxalase superfamily)
MFTGSAEQAMRFYASTFPDAEISQLERFGAGEAGPEGGVKQGVVRIGRQHLRFLDSPDVHSFGFTPAISLFVDCGSADEVDRLYEALSTEGQPLMPVDSYPFAERFAWVADRFGVSWQLSFTRPDLVGQGES